MAKVLLVGGTGFIGQELGQRLVARGHVVSVLTRGTERYLNKMAFPCSLHEWREPDYIIPDGLLESHDVIINLSGASVVTTKWNQDGKRKIISSRTQTTTALVCGLKNIKGDKVLIQASAVGFYGNRADDLLDETSERGTKGFLPEVCAAWEAPLSELTASSTRVCTMRFGAVLGHGGGALEKLDTLYSSGFGACLGNGKHYFSWVHIEDLCELIMTAMLNSSYKGIFNITAPNPVPYKVLHNELRQAKRVSALPPIPTTVVKLVFGKQAEFLLSSQRVVPQKALSLGYTFKFPDLKTALSDLYEHQKKPGVFTLLRKLWLADKPETLWPFFCDEKNLEVLTPKFLQFHVVGKSSDTIREGSLIDYRFRIHGVPVRWQSRIESWQPTHSFVDTQVKGPYGYWHHEHRLLSLGGGTLLVDQIQYKVPLGRLGAYVLSALIQRDVNAIFNFRSETMAEILARRKLLTQAALP